MHPDWDPSRVTDGGNDLMLIRLSDPVATFIEDGAQKVLPACLPWGEDEAAYLQGQDDRSHYVAGWGKDMQVQCWAKLWSLGCVHSPNVARI